MIQVKGTGLTNLLWKKAMFGICGELWCFVGVFRAFL
jgi:hypothetical protein